MIGPDAYALIVAGLLGLLVLALWIERLPFGRILPGPAVMLVGAVALTNLGVLPRGSPLYGEIIGFAVPIAVFLLLLRANITQILRETGSILVLYLLGAAAAVIGVIVAYLIVPVPQASEIAAIQTANLVGGTVNVIAVSTAVNLDNTVLTAMLAGGAPVMTLYLMLVGVLNASPALNRWLPGKDEPDEGAIAQPAASPAVEAAPGAGAVDSLHLAIVLAMAVAAYAVCDLALRELRLQQYLIVVVTLVALLVANCAPRGVAKLSGDREIGTMLMYIFFATLGMDVDLAAFGQVALMMSIFIAVAMAVHLVIILGAARLLRAGLPETLVGSIAGVAGPTTAAAMAAGFGRRSLITPGILCGLLGFAGATFVAMTLYGLMGGTPG